MSTHVRTRVSAIALGAVVIVAPAVTSCTVAGAGADGENTVTVGYQSKTINTVTAGTLLRERGFFEDELDKLDDDHDVKWLDYDTGAPITAQMVAGKIDIGSMGDYPMLINGSRAGTSDESGTEMIAITGYNVRGALNGVVVDKGSAITDLEDLLGKSISASVGSAGHGTIVQALDRAGIDPNNDVSIENQEPSVGSSALDSGSTDAFAQFVAWPGLLTFRDDARLVYDGGALDVPTLHGTVTRKAYADEDPEVVEAFLKAQIRATEYLHEHPMEAAQIVAEETGLPAEVVYLYNGRNGVATFDSTIKKPLVKALRQDQPFLESIGVVDETVDLDAFIDDSTLDAVYDGDLAADTKSMRNPAAINGQDAVCKRKVDDPATAGEIWVEGEDDTRPAADPRCLLRNIAAVHADGGDVRAAYVPDAKTGTRWFADAMVWVRDGEKLVPFATQSSADSYLDAHNSAKQVSYDDAIKAA